MEAALSLSFVLGAAFFHLMFTGNIDGKFLSSVAKMVATSGQPWKYALQSKNTSDTDNSTSLFSAQESVGASSDCCCFHFNRNLSSRRITKAFFVYLTLYQNHLSISMHATVFFFFLS